MAAILAERSPIVSIFNAFSPTTGYNVGQLAVYCDGSCLAFGDAALLRAQLIALGVPFTPALTAALAACEPRAAAPPSFPLSKRKRGRPRKATSSAHAVTADGVE